MYGLFLGLLLLPTAGWALFSGNDQYDRTDLNTERLLDQEHFIDLLAYRPFWRPKPGEENPKGFARTTDGSITNNRLYVQREAGIRGAITPRSFWGYQVRQLNDLEQDFFYQYFEVQSPLAGPVGWRIFGEPASRKQNADLGFGGVLTGDHSELRLEATMVDFLFNEKNLDQQRDERKFYTFAAAGRRRFQDGGLEGSVEWDTPLARDFLTEGTRFGHKRLAASLRGEQGPWEGSLGWNVERRFVDSVALGGREQDFRKEVYRGEVLRRFGGRRPFRAGIQAQRRRADFDRPPQPSEAFHQQRWELDPYVGTRIALSAKHSLEVDVFHAFVWQSTRVETTPHRKTDFSLQAKAKTAWRIDFAPAVSLVLNPTWDLDKLLSGDPGNAFDGGNIQLRAELF